MSIVTSSHLDICNDPTNNSPAKVQYSFDKEPRFRRSYDYYNSNKNPNLCYFDGEFGKSKLSTMSKKQGKFPQRARLDNVFVEFNR